MTFGYGEIAGIATDVLTELNQGTILFYVVTKGTGPATNPGPSTRSAPYTLKGVAKNISPERIANSNGMLNSGDLEVIVAVHPTAPSPKKGDVLAIDGLEYNVVLPTPTPGAGTIVVWKLIVRR